MEDHYHVPVMGQEVSKHLIVNKNGIYLDGTLGGGAHAKLILSQLSDEALYLGIDRDMDAINRAQERLKEFPVFRAHCTTFDNINAVLEEEGVDFLDGIFLDLGVSSWQIDQDKRGFSFRQGVNLDMRMNGSQELTAKWIVNNYSLTELKRIFKEYGEERFSGKIAFLVVKNREEKELEKSTDLIKIIDKCVNPRFATKSYARIFQALRIEVNDELGALSDLLDQSAQLLVPGGRLVVISYHSLEDRMVKNYIAYGNVLGTDSKDLYGHRQGLKFTSITKKPTTPSVQELQLNPRSRSGKLRVAERI